MVLVLALLAGCDKAGLISEPDPGSATAPATVRGSATLSWTAPTNNTDGSKLTDVSGYKIYYGTSKKYLQRVIVVDDPGATSYTIKDLPPLTYYFSITAYDSTGAESERSNMQTKTIQ